MEKQGERNVYTCEKCGYRHWTINREDGVTPFMIRCKYRECNGEAISGFYRLPPGTPDPEWEWYRPDDDDPVMSYLGMRQHVEMGGLMIRAIEIPVPSMSTHTPDKPRKPDREKRHLPKRFA